MDRVERTIQELERKREIFEREVMKLHDDMSLIVKNLFEVVTNEINPFLGETDKTVENCIKDFNRMESRRRELDSLRAELRPVFDILNKPE